MTLETLCHVDFTIQPSAKGGLFMFENSSSCGPRTALLSPPGPLSPFQRDRGVGSRFQSRSPAFTLCDFMTL